MRHKDPELMKKIRTYIGEFYIEHDRTPSTTEIAKYFGIARSTSQNYLVAMNERGLLSYQGGRLVVDKMDKLRTDRQQAPLVGSVPCGELTYEEENVECVTTLPTAIFGDGPFYILHASGDSTNLDCWLKNSGKRVTRSIMQEMRIAKFAGGLIK